MTVKSRSCLLAAHSLLPFHAPYRSQACLPVSRHHRIAQHCQPLVHCFDTGLCEAPRPLRTREGGIEIQSTISIFLYNYLFIVKLKLLRKLRNLERDITVTVG